jgi:hypothetical protein
MKTICRLLLFICLVASTRAAGFRVYSLVTLTNNANLTNGIQISVNGVVRTGEDIVTNVLSQFARSNRIDYAMTNLAGHIVAHPFTNVVFQYGTGTNNFYVIGGTNLLMTVSMLGSWGNVTNYTNAVYGASTVTTPLIAESNTFKNALMSSLLTDLQTWATNKFSNNAPALSMFLSTLTNGQNATNISFYRGNWFGALSGAQLSGAVFTNGALWLTNNNATPSFIYINQNTIFTNAENGKQYIMSGYSLGAESILTLQDLADNVIPVDGTQFITDSYTVGSEPLAIADGSYQTNVQFFGPTNTVRGAIDIASATVHTGNLTGQVVTATSSADLTSATIRSAPAITGNLAVVTTVLAGTATINAGQTTNSYVETTNLVAGAADISTLTGRGGSLSNINLSANNAAVGKTLVTNATRYGQSGPWAFDEGTYATLTGGGSNNNVQLSTNAWTRLSGQSSACNVNSLQTGDGLPMAGPLGSGGRRAGVVNGGSSALTFVGESGFATQATNRMTLLENFTLQPNGRAEFIYNSSATRWEVITPQPASNAVVAAFGQLISNTDTNTMTTGGTFYRWTNAATFTITNLVASSSGTNLVPTVPGWYEVQIELYGALGNNAGQVATNMVFTNGVACQLARFTSDLDYGGGIGFASLGGSGGAFVYLPAGCSVDMRSAIAASADTFTASRRRLSIRFIAP